jgi:hypothetical protein
MKSDPIVRTRRDALQHAAAALAGGSLAGCATGAAPAARVPMRFNDPKWNRDTKARIDGDLDPKKQVYGFVQGTVLGVRDGERTRPLMRFEVFSTIRILTMPDGNYQRLCREVVFYRDIATGKLMDDWDNPYTGERVKVVDVANDPYNYRIADTFGAPPSMGGQNNDKAPPAPRPFLLNWTVLGPDTVGLETDVHLYYPSALKPDKWPRESPGPMTRASEMFRFIIRREDIENPALTHIPYEGIWNRITPWLPWMLMDQAPGHCLYVGNMGGRQTMDLHPADVIERVRTRYPLYLTAPESWDNKPSMSSLEHYAAEQTPAPPRKKP